jgi:hypothetical protein
VQRSDTYDKAFIRMVLVKSSPDVSSSVRLVAMPACEQRTSWISREVRKVNAYVCKENIQSAFFFERLLAHARNGVVVSSIGLDGRSLREGEVMTSRIKVTLAP